MDARPIRVELARAADEPALRRLLRESPLPGWVSLSLEREPDFHRAAAVEGERSDVVVARDGEGTVVALGARSVRRALVNGAPARVGYLGQLRAAGRARGALSAFRAGFSLLAARRAPEELPFDFASIAADNAPARRLLEAGVAGLPRFRALGELETFLLLPGRRCPRREGLAVERGSAGRLEELAAFLRAEGSRRQLASCPDAADLASPARTPGLAPEDFLLVRRGGRLVACGALWDQRSFKQAVVRGYAGPLGAARPLLALLRPVLGAMGLPPLPPVGAALPAAFLAFACAAEDEPAPFDALLDAALGEARARALGALVLGLAAAHPLAGVARRRRPRAYRTRLYAVHGPEGAAAVEALDGRLPGPEVATL